MQWTDLKSQNLRLRLKRLCGGEQRTCAKSVTLADDSKRVYIIEKLHLLGPTFVKIM